MDLRAVVSPKDFSPLTLRTPILVRGTLGDPAVSIEAGKLVGKAARRRRCSASAGAARGDRALHRSGRPGRGEGDGSACAELVRTSGSDLGGDAAVPAQGAAARRRGAVDAAREPAADGAAARELGPRSGERRRRQCAACRCEPAFALRVRLAGLLGLLHLSASSVEPGAASRAAGSTLPDSANSRAALS